MRHSKDRSPSISWLWIVGRPRRHLTRGAAAVVSRAATAPASTARDAGGSAAAALPHRRELRAGRRVSHQGRKADRGSESRRLRAARKRRQAADPGVRARGDQPGGPAVDAGRRPNSVRGGEQMASNPRNRVFVIFLDMPQRRRRVGSPGQPAADSAGRPDPRPGRSRRGDDARDVRGADHLRPQDRSHRGDAVRYGGIWGTRDMPQDLDRA